MYLGTNTTVLRKFNYIATRALIHKTAELQQLEVDLFHMDAADERANPGILRCQDGYIENRGPMIDKIVHTYRSYGRYTTLPYITCKVLALTED